MKANEIETQMQIVHFSVERQLFMIQSTKDKVLPPTFKPFRIISKERFKKFYKFITVSIIVERRKRPISFSFLEEQFKKFHDKENEALQMDANLLGAKRILDIA